VGHDEVQLGQQLGQTGAYRFEVRDAGADNEALAAVHLLAQQCLAHNHTVERHDHGAGSAGGEPVGWR
jgi:hypothetical protein